MARQSIEIPDAIFELDIDHEFIDRDRYVSRWRAQIVVGGVVVMERTYHDDDSRYDDNYAYDQEDVQDKVLRAFGERLRTVIGDTQ